MRVQRVRVPESASYGFTLPMRAPIDEGHRVRLTIAASLAVPGMRLAVGEPYLQALRHMIDLYTNRPIHSDKVPTVILLSSDLTAALPSLKPWFVKVLPDLLLNEPAIVTNGAHLGDGSWEREVTRSVWQYRHVRTVEDYIAKTIEIVTAEAANPR
ncbi:hypothetical protein [Streptomyces sp. NPDC059171]|uniref:hypothetical protein n=1 Tax=Streptomyces sp. NPDC059171 TaxID=3346755 RepID=UPI00369F0C04